MPVPLGDCGLNAPASYSCLFPLAILLPPEMSSDSPQQKLNLALKGKVSSLKHLQDFLRGFGNLYSACYFRVNSIGFN